MTWKKKNGLVWNTFTDFCEKFEKDNVFNPLELPSWVITDASQVFSKLSSMLAV